jgi:hypothetical protein
MKIIELKTLENGSHRNQMGDFTTIPEGYAVIPDGVETPNFPFGEVTAREIDGIMTVTNWVAGVIPEEEPIPETESEPTTEELINIILGVNE